MCASLIGLGIGRFAYVPLLPLMIDSGWTSVTGAAQLAAANLMGYLIGSAGAHQLSLRFGAVPVIRSAMLAVLLSLLACSLNLGIGWLWSWRMVAGASGGILMILAAPFLMQQVPAHVRGNAIGIVFAGIGVGVVLSGLVVPALGAGNLAYAWLVLAAFVGVALFVAWPKFSQVPGVGVQDVPVPEILALMQKTALSEKVVPLPPVSMLPLPVLPPKTLFPRGALLLLLCAYVLDAIGYLPHTVFWVEYLVRDLGKSLAIGGAFWAIFGAGAALGPLLTGLAADRFGFRHTLVACFICKAAAVALPLVSTSMPALFVSSFMVGALTPGMVAVASGRVIEIAGPAAHQRNWAMMTFFYALIQALAGYAMAGMYSATHSFTVLFSVAAFALLLAALIASVRHDVTTLDPKILPVQKANR